MDNLLIISLYILVMSSNARENIQIAIAIMKKKARSKRTFIIGAGLLLLLLIVVVAVVVVMRRKKDTAKASGEFEGLSVAQIREKVSTAAEKLGIPVEEMQTALSIEIKEEQKERKRCIVSPLLNGTCGAGYYLENECCYASDPKTSKMLENLELARDIAIEVSVGLAAGMVLEYMIKRGLGSRAAVGGVKATKAAASAAKAARTAAAAAKAARAVSVAAAKAGTATAKYSTAASAGPPGWIAGALMLLFDAVSLTLDLLDVDGYDSFTPQKTIENMRNIIDYSMASEFEKLDMGYPFMFPITVAFPAEMAIAQEYMAGQISAKYMDTEIELPKNKAAKDAFDMYVKSIVDNPDSDSPVPEAFTAFIVRLIEEKHVDRDKAIFTKLNEVLGDRAYKIAFYESLSTPDRMGVSLSQEGAKEWNSEHEAEWLEGVDMDAPEDTKSSVMPTACYTDTYYVYTSGDANNPNMIAKKLPEKTVLGNYYGPLLSYCEKSRQLKSTSTSVNPRELGTRFNNDTGVCEFSRDMCKRYGLEFKNNDCKPKPGQNVAEMIFGTTITRASVREWDTRKDDFNSGDPGRVTTALLKTLVDPTGINTTIVNEAKKSYAKNSTPATKGGCPSGMRDDGMNCYLDPVYRGIGKIPDECRAGQTKIGLRCYEPCPENYEPNPVMPSFCEPKCGGKYPIKDGLMCYENCAEKGGGWFNGSLFECAACNNGWKSDGFLGCSRSSPPGWKGFWPYRKTRGQKGIGVGKPRKSHSVKCADDKVNDDGLCYPTCSPKGDQGQYKYNGVLDWCQPEGAAGIKKGLDDRWECPEGWDNKAGICYEKCKEGERDDGLFCKKAG
jgi:hypothetical protein